MCPRDLRYPPLHHRVYAGARAMAHSDLKVGYAAANRADQYFGIGVKAVDRLGAPTAGR